MKKPYKHLLLLTLCICSIIIAFYIYAAHEFSNVVEESTMGIIEFISKDKDKTVTVYNEDSIKLILADSNISFLLERFLDKDTISFIIWKDNLIEQSIIDTTEY